MKKGGSVQVAPSLYSFSPMLKREFLTRQAIQDSDEEFEHEEQEF